MVESDSPPGSKLGEELSKRLDSSSRSVSQPHKKRLAVIGTLIWDRILYEGGEEGEVETWGGISYSLEALSVALPPDWVVAPLIQIGDDREGEARSYLSTIPGVDLGAGLVSVDSPTTSVELQYEEGVRRAERLSGRLPPWPWELLEPLLAHADAVYVNFITGFEMELHTTRRFRQQVSVPTYADLHSLFLAISHDGLRRPQPLKSWETWAQAFDVVQMNEEEFGLLGGVGGDPWARAEEAMGEDLKLLVVTLGSRGSSYLGLPGVLCRGEPWEEKRGTSRRLEKPVRGHIPPADQVPLGDPTGCGDVWGATFFARLLAGDGLRRAMSRSNAAAARNVSHVGAPGLHRHLMDERELGFGIGGP